MFGATPAMAERDARFVERRDELAAQRRREKARQGEVLAGGGGGAQYARPQDWDTPLTGADIVPMPQLAALARAAHGLPAADSAAVGRQSLLVTPTNRVAT